MSKVFLTSLLLVFTFHANADRDQPVHPGAGRVRGNENSARVTALATGQPVYGGNACPQGTMRVVFAPDFLSFSMLFDQFVATINDGTNSHRDVMNCDAMIPMHIPAGMQMEITRVDLRGFLGLPVQAHGQLHSVFNFRGPGGDRDKINLHFQFQGPVTDNYLLSTDAMNTAVSEASPCGGDTVLRVMSELRLTAPPKAGMASVTLDSVDSSGQTVYYVNWKTCPQTHSQY
jgi:hypothetical protein